jgi:cellulose synthase/poly-beta-1,6-N-acetylglucosamine synthase-like glycosyltransferase
MILLNVFGYALFAFCLGSVGYLAFFALAGHLPKRRSVGDDVLNKPLRFSILIPAFREDDVILETMRSLRRLEYPRGRYDVVVIADSLREQTILELRYLGALVVEFSDPNRTKVKALNAGLARLTSMINDVAVVLDADNVVEPDFLRNLNSAFLNGARVVQCRRVAKNLDTPMAYLDAVSEGINNHIFRQGHSAIGLSAGLIGSGMAFEFDLLKSLLAGDRTINGFDKALEFALFKRGVRVSYLRDVLVFDEKVRSREVFKTQRTRWLASQWLHVREQCTIPALLFGSRDLIDKIIQLIIPPRLLLLVLLACCTAAGALGVTGPTPGTWSLLLSAYAFTLLLSIPRRLWSVRLFLSIAYIPVAAGTMIGALFNLRRARTAFLHTPHATAANVAGRTA